MTYDVNEFPGRTIQHKNETFLYFGGTAYLGLQTDEDFQNLFIANLKKYGTNYGASRKSNIRISIFKTAESKLAELVGSEACTTLSSGYLAGQIVAQHFTGPDFKCYYAPDTHAAIMNTNGERFSTYSKLSKALLRRKNSDYSSQAVVLLDSIDFSGRNYPLFKALNSLALQNVILVVDDSHGLGVVGKNGGGVYGKLQQLASKELIICGSLGKGFGVQAGAIFGTDVRIQNIQATAFFGGASPATPAAMATWIASNGIYAKKRQTLQDNIRFFLKELHRPGLFSFMQDFPVFSYTDPQLTAKLNHHKIIVTDFKYPDENSENMSRIVLSAHHTINDIQSLLKAIRS